MIVAIRKQRFPGLFKPSVESVIERLDMRLPVRQDRTLLLSEKLAES